MMPTYTVTELNGHVKQRLSSDPELNKVWVQGEISNLTRHSSGHYYFTIKDEKSQLNCVSFRSVNAKIRFEPEKAMKVLVFGSIDVYTVRGQYQLIVQDMRPDGIGELYKAYEQLKKKLALEGLFSDTHKRPIPPYPKKIGVVTSPTGAAIHDIINVIERRYPASILLCPAIVQGEHSAPSIVKAIEMLNTTNVDVLIVGRGGGSLEDLWSFNEESVARAIFNSTKPVISAVGHETDFTIADLTADLRAPTPSAAAELVVPDKTEILSHLRSARIRMNNAIRYNMLNKKKKLEHLQMEKQHEILLNRLQHNTQHLDELTSRLIFLIRTNIGNKNNELKVSVGRLNAISPLNTIQRGYSIALKDGQRTTIRSIRDIEEKETFDLVLKDGFLECIAENKREDGLSRFLETKE